ncbi:hypothetical protein [Abyssogena phaseoliformis symbiont]|uniref:hypothetical protein n=1 Tax=Abyssogena phaseoliformis symbiont TaxID=596095 RepID=UPI001916A30B|nr:hypothetical protein [Abyssogena phaseoliformis symbiont]
MGGKIIRNSLPVVLKGRWKNLLEARLLLKLRTILQKILLTVLIDNYQEEKTTLEDFKNAIFEILKAIDKREQAFCYFY